MIEDDYSPLTEDGLRMLYEWEHYNRMLGRLKGYNDPNHPHWDNVYKPPLGNRSGDRRLDPMTIQGGSLLNLWPQRTDNMADWDTIRQNIWDRNFKKGRKFPAM